MRTPPSASTEGGGAVYRWAIQSRDHGIKEAYAKSQNKEKREQDISGEACESAEYYRHEICGCCHLPLSFRHRRRYTRTVKPTTMKPTSVLIPVCPRSFSPHSQTQIPPSMSAVRRAQRAGHFAVARASAPRRIRA